MSLRLVSVNVRGLRSSDKRLNLFNQLLQSRWDIVFLQETYHASPAEADLWLRHGAGPGRALQWQSFWSHGSTHSRGAGVLINPGAPFTAQGAAMTDRAGRVVRVDGTLQDEPITLVNVYAPVEPENRADFFLNVLLPMLPTDRPLCIGGDFNCIADLRDQRSSSPSRHRLTGYAGGLEVVENSRDLVDAWRHQHPTNSTAFTFVAQQSAARLDRWLISSSLLSRLERTNIDLATGLPGDHLPVSLSLKPPIALPRGPGVWCFPAHLLDDPALRDLVRQTIAEHARTFTTDGATPAADFWETLKRGIRDVAHMYSFDVARDRRRQQKALHKRLAQAAAQLAADPADPAASQQWHDAQQQLKAQHVAKAKVAALRAGVLWQDFGEQSTFWFHRMGKLRQARTVITTLMSDPSDADTEFALTSAATRSQAERVIMAYYSGESKTGLFRIYPTDINAQTTLLASVDTTLTQEQARACAGPDGGGRFTASELATALSTTANNKRPGPDGLPYEFYKVFWDDVVAHLLAVCAEAFSQGALPESMTTGVVALLYKDKGSRADLNNYRPITLLNTDYKLIAKAFANRIADPLSTVLEPTQTAFMPGRWIGDNILNHLEEVEYLHAESAPGCVLFLDFEKAFDRVSRPWIQRCMERLGFEHTARRWASILHSNTFVHIMYNGWRTDRLPLHSGVFQGSPLSPLLFNIAVQPLASHMQRLHASGRIHGITLPDGCIAPITHQHADDTTVHTRTLQDAKTALDEGVELFCRATGARLNRDKSSGFAFNQLTPVSLDSIDPTTGIRFVSHNDHIRHLGILISPADPAQASTIMFTRIKRGIAARIAHWSAQHLSPLGRMHVAKQVLASMLYHHATFIPPSRDMLRSITSLIDSFVTPAGRYHPAKPITCLPEVDGGMKAVHVPVMLQALHAKIWGRLCMPDLGTTWKQLLLHKLAHSAWGHWDVGSFAPLSTIPLALLGAGSRVTAYMHAFRALHLHRTPLTGAIDPSQLLTEKLFYNRRITDLEGRPLGGSQWAALARAGCTTVLHLLRVRAGGLTLPPPARLLADRICLPADWQAVLGDRCLDSLLTWRLVDSTTVGDFSTAPPTLYTRGVAGTLQPCASTADHPLPPVSSLPSVVVYKPVAPAPSSESAAPPPAPVVLGLLTVVHVHPLAWSLGMYTLDLFVVHRAVTRLLRLEALGLPRSPFRPGHGVPPRVWRSLDGDGLDMLTDLERTWRLLYEERLPAPTGAGHRRQRAVEGDLADVYHVGWMDPPAPRPHWQARQRALLPDAVGAGAAEVAAGRHVRRRDDTIDVLAPPPGAAPPWRGVWSSLKTLALPRPVLFSNWTALHAALPFGAPRLRSSPPDAAITLFQCPHACCNARLQTVSHVFLSCPVAVAAWSWLRRLWRGIAGVLPPDPSVQLMVAGDPAAWAVPAQQEWLWHTLRCYMVHTIREEAAAWVAPAGDGGVGAEDRAPAAPGSRVIAGFVGVVRSAIQRDWMRTQRDPRQCLPGTFSSWFRGRDPCLTVGEFRERWAHGGVLCSVSQQLELAVHLSFSSAG